MNTRVQEYLELFRDESGTPTSSESVPPAAFDRYKGRLPEALLEFWKLDGWASYRDGLWWLVDPERHDGLVREWLEGTPFENVDRYHMIARSAFGAFYAWGEKLNRHVLVDCAHNHIVALPAEYDRPNEDPDLALCILISGLDRLSGDIEDDSGESLFDAAIRKCGAPGSDEVFGFEPALILGGDASIRNVEKLRMDVHLSILRQFGVPRIPGF